VIEHQDDLVSLNTGPLSFEQKAEIIMICNQRMLEYMKKRGIAIWDYRLLDTEPVSDSLRYQVLKDSGGHCCLCGVTLYERPLDVDHIIPRSRGGKTELANLQTLCSKCNRSKRNKDATDFRKYDEHGGSLTCDFCSEDFKAKAIEAHESVFVVLDSYPVTQGHLLVVPNRHTQDFFSMTAAERANAEQLIRYMRNKTLQEDSTVSGFNIGVNCGPVAGQTIMHAHIHLIPRREGDTSNPRGGVRGVIPDKMTY
jgi:ATP adenylyltransferase